MSSPPPNPKRRHSPAAERNRGPILLELQRLLALQGRAIEIASGTGQHVAHFAAALPQWRFWPTDFEAAALASIDAWAAGLPNVEPACRLDVTDARWPQLPTEVDAMLCANMLHISPWATCAGLMQGAARHLAATGLLLTYGPYREDGVPTAPSNEAFDADLRERNPEWGLRRLQAVAEVAQAAGLVLRERVAMPANNLLLAWARRD